MEQARAGAPRRPHHPQTPGFGLDHSRRHVMRMLSGACSHLAQVLSCLAYQAPAQAARQRRPPPPLDIHCASWCVEGTRAPQLPPCRALSRRASSK